MILNDKSIVFVEPVGPDSRVLRLIREAKGQGRNTLVRGEFYGLLLDGRVFGSYQYLLDFSGRALVA